MRFKEHLSSYNDRSGTEHCGELKDKINVDKIIIFYIYI